MDGSSRPDSMRFGLSDTSDSAGPSSGNVSGRTGKEDVMITLSVSPELPVPPRTRSPLARSHLRSRSLVGIPGMPSMMRAYSSPGLDSRGRYIFVNGRGVPTPHPSVDAKRSTPLQMRPDDHIETRLGSLNISETISENAELETAPRSPSSQSGSSPVLMPQTFPRVGRLRSTSPLHFQPSINSPPFIHTSPMLGSKYNESYPSHSASSTSSVPSTPSSIRSRSPSISSLETIPDIPDAEAQALEDERIAELKAAADAADTAEDASNANRRRGTSDASPATNTFNAMRGGSSIYAPRSDKRKRWSVCGAERRQDLDLETIWED
ncbi:hypothetical protein N7462_009825 [Penicillium macrosclerotiorum]|uniref:uncharacterized protein n=1 Tax=Penicillium macrosclerotiorum TaxID=303699 RepID=UPI002546668C|nr:uncharacterized protein N7462_009825 [Penicillium macrosclerotiorum]KAJ5668755.1 hypothetical protein N7462_009825 [Penicillium macrosclerotiorum]